MNYMGQRLAEKLVRVGLSNSGCDFSLNFLAPSKI